MNSRVNLEHQDAVILHQYNYRNSSLIINFFLRDYGKISAVARGIKGKNSNKYQQNHPALFQPFQRLVISLSGKYDLLYLKNIELSNVYPDLNIKPNGKLKGKSLYCAYYINELLLRLLPSHTDCKEIFNLYHFILNSLIQCSETSVPDDRSLIHYEAPLRLFELKLLEFLGYGLNLMHEIQSGVDIQADQQYYYIIESGPSKNKSITDQQLLISGSTLINLANGNLNDKKTLQQSKQLLKLALAAHLGDKPLKSRELFKQLYSVVK